MDILSLSTFSVGLVGVMARGLETRRGPNASIKGINMSCLDATVGAEHAFAALNYLYRSVT